MSRKKDAKRLSDAVRAAKAKNAFDEQRRAAALARREERLQALRQGRKQRAVRFDDGRKKASKNACRGPVRDD